MLHEIESQLSELSIPPSTPKTFICPVGVGSLAQAVTTHAKAPGNAWSPSWSRGQLPSTNTILTVEPTTAPCLQQSLLSGSLTTINTSTTIMAGLNCGTVSTTAWPILKGGVDAAVAVSDIETHQAVEELRSLGVNAGPCGAAALAGLRRVMKLDGDGKAVRDVLELGEESVVVLICSEGRREYEVPGT